MRPRRARCGSCSVTHVLLAVSCLLRRADGVDVIGRALQAKAAGAGHRPIAVRLERPVSTVRGWLRAFAGNAEVVRSVFTALCCSYAGVPGRRRRSLRISHTVDAATFTPRTSSSPWIRR